MFLGGYGHSSWIALVVFGGMFALRYVSMQRRRGGRPPGGRRPGSTPGSFFTGSGSPRPPGPPGSSTLPTGSTPTGPAGSSGMPAGWFRDPFFKHEQRFWSGTEWTEHVTDGGVPGTEPPPNPGQLDP
jgi:Protein of unknown function (DUF2510)